MQQPPRILIVNDEPGLRLTLSTILGQQSFQVTAASTVAEALALITASPYDALVSDLNIGQPGDGFSVVSAMRRVQPDAVTLILTGFPAFESALRAIREQVDDFLTKPADVRELVTSIKDKLEHPRRQPDSSSKRLPQHRRRAQGRDLGGLVPIGGIESRDREDPPIAGRTDQQLGGSSGRIDTGS
jgi:DNA-binding NtrC family response regulator